MELGPLQATAVQGGDINQAFRLSGEGVDLFIKVNRAERLPMFEAERVGLDTIRASRSIRVPEVRACGRSGSHAYLALEYIELVGSPSPEAFAPALAAMHACSGRQFGFAGDNTIGSTPQVNSPSDDWIDFWRHRRLGYQLELAAQNRFDAALLDAGARLQESLEAFFGAYRPRPSLLHGDLWSGNQAADAEANPVIFDPACYFGDHEADLAMMELFGAPGERFFSIYAECFPIDSGYALRRDLYNLYHILNHAILFGGAYPARALRLMHKLLAQI